MSNIILSSNPLDFANTTTCLNCANFFTCRDPHKSSEWTCTKFERLDQAHTDDLLGQAQHHIDLNSTLDLNFVDDENELGEFEAMVRDALGDNRLLPLDLNVNCSDFPEAKNYYDWTCGSGHIKFIPFSRQLWVAAHTFGEICPFCSDKDWYNNVEAIPVDYKAIEMPDKLQFLEYGICPRCHRTRSEMWLNKDINIPQELALCVSGDSRIQTKHGLLPIRDVSAEGVCHSGHRPRGYFNWVNKGVKKVCRTIGRTGHYTETTSDHRHLVWVKGDLAWKEQVDLSKKDMLIVRLGYSNPVKTYARLNLPDVDVAFSRTGTATKPKLFTESFAYLLGLWESDGHYRVSDASLFNTNLDILEKARACILDVFGLDVTYSQRTECEVGSERDWGDLTFRSNMACYGVYLRNVPASTWLGTVGSGKKSVDNHVPSAVWESPDSVVLAYLAGYLDGDGCHANKDTSRRVSFNSSSAQQLDGIHQLLTRLGVMSYLKGSCCLVEGQPVEKLISLLEPYTVRSFEQAPLKDQQSGYYGIPAQRVWETIDANLIAQASKTKGYQFKKGVVADTSTWTGYRALAQKCLRTKFLCPYKAAAGYYDNLLNLVEQLDAAVTAPIRRMIANNWVAIPVVRKEAAGEIDVYDISVDDDQSFLCNGVLVHNCLGQRSGKSIQTAGLASYHIHKILKTVRPSEYYGLAGSTTLTHTYTALQFKRAYSLLWTPIRDTILDSPWFKRYHLFLKSEGDRIGEELVTLKDTFINWRRSRFAAAPAAPNVGTLRGDTRAGGGVDELGFFKFGAGAEDFVTISADEIHASITNSLATVRTAASKLLRGGESNVQQGLMFNLSSPSNVFDKIMTLVRASQNSRVLFGLRLPTWEVNPLVTREDLQIYWDTDPIKAERDFGANPPLAAAPFFEDKVAIANLFTGERNRVAYKYLNRSHPGTGVAERGGAITKTMELPKQPQSLMTLDAGVTNNSFSLAISVPYLKGRVSSAPRQNSLGYANRPKKPLPPRRDLDVNSELTGSSSRCQVQLVIEIIPPPGGRINFKRVYSGLIVPLLVPFNVGVVVTDRWNSIFLLDSLRDDHAVDTFQYSLRYKDFEGIRSYMDHGGLLLPKPETQGPDLATIMDTVLNFDQEGYPGCFEGRPVDHLMMQFVTVQDNGRTVDKGANLTDDSFRAVALAMHYLRDVDFVTQYLSGNARERSSGMGLVAAPGSGDQTALSYGMTSNSNRAVVAMPGGGGGESATVFARTKR